MDRFADACNDGGARLANFIGSAVARALRIADQISFRISGWSRRIVGKFGPGPAVKTARDIWSHGNAVPPDALHHVPRPDQPAAPLRLELPSVSIEDLLVSRDSVSGGRKFR